MVGCKNQRILDAIKTNHAKSPMYVPTLGKMRNKRIAMNGPHSFYMKAVMSASKWGKRD